MVVRQRGSGRLYGGYDGVEMMIQDIDMVGRERLAFLYGLYSGCAESETELNAKGIYQKIASELAWCLELNDNESKCYEMNGE